jgi:hypothetical protein
MKAQPVAALVASGQATRVAPDRTDLLNAIRDELLARATDEFKTVAGIENMNAACFARMSTANTNFDIFVDVLRQQGLDTPRTMGGVMAALDLTQRQMHHIACYCEHGPRVTAMEMELNLSAVDQHR